QHQHLNTSIPQHLNTSAHQHISYPRVPLPNINTYVRKRLNTSSNPRLIRIQLIIPSLCCNKLIMSSAFGDATLFDDEDLIGLTNRAETVGNDKSGTAFH